MMARARFEGLASGTAEGVAVPPPHMAPESVRVLHRVVLGLNTAQPPEIVAVDSIVSVGPSPVPRTPPQTLLVCSRTALPIAADPSAFAFCALPSGRQHTPMTSR